MFLCSLDLLKCAKCLVSGRLYWHGIARPIFHILFKFQPTSLFPDVDNDITYNFIFSLFMRSFICAGNVPSFHSTTILYVLLYVFYYIFYFMFYINYVDTIYIFFGFPYKSDQPCVTPLVTLIAG